MPTTPKRKKTPSSAKKPKSIPFEFVLDELADANPTTRPMFGCTGVYVGGKIVVILREKLNDTDNGVWIATTQEHHESLRHEFPNMRSISVLGTGVTGWQILPAEAPDFESSVSHLCELILDGDRRVGKIPGAKKKKPKSKKARD